MSFLSQAAVRDRIAAAMKPQAFSLGRAIHQMYNDGGLRNGPELDIAQQLAERAGAPFDMNRIHLPWPVLGVRDMTQAGSAGSDFLVGVDAMPTALSLNGASLAQESGATIMFGMRGDAAMPRIAARPAAYWLADENTAITPAQPTIGVVAAAPKSVAVLVQGSRLLRVQSPELVDTVLQAELSAKLWLAIDAAIVSGSGTSGEPYGLAGRLTPVSGTSLSWASIIDMKKLVTAGGARRVSVWAGPAAEKALRGRERFTGAGSIWADNGVAGLPSYGTPAVPDQTLVIGDFSTLRVLIWGNPRLELNPFADMSRGYWQARLIVDCEFLIPHAAAFQIATSIT